MYLNTLFEKTSRAVQNKRLLRGRELPFTLWKRTPWNQCGMPLQCGATFTRSASDNPSLRALLLMAALNWLLLIVSIWAVIDNSFSYSRAFLCGEIFPAFQGICETLGSSPGNPPEAHIPSRAWRALYSCLLPLHRSVWARGNGITEGALSLPWVLFCYMVPGAEGGKSYLISWAVPPLTVADLSSAFLSR